MDDDTPHWTDSVILLSDVTQSIFGFVTGCAWSDWLFETVTVLGADPTWDVILKNLVIVCLITVLSCYWLIMNASSDGIDESVNLTEEEKQRKAEEKATDRNEVEKQFFSGALGFFVLGGWLTVTRNLFAPFMLAKQSYRTFRKAVFTHPTVGELLPWILDDLQPLGDPLR